MSSPRIHDDQGWAVLTAIALMTIMIGLGLATLSMVDTQQEADMRQRVGESRFNLTEAVLTSQAFGLARRWPMGSSATQLMPVSCTGNLASPAAPADTRCPDPSSLASTFTGVDYGQGATFTTEVRDNTTSPQAVCPVGPPAATADFYDPASIPNQARWDSNCDGKMWVRADATVKGKTRTVVALVRADLQAVGFPRKTVVAGKIGTSNNGNKTIIDTDGYAGQAAAEPGGVSLRCSASAGAACNATNMSKGQISPPIIEYDYPSTNVLDPATLALLKEQAQAAGTYYATCPGSLTGAVVWVEAGACAYGANGVANTSAQPGVVVIANGSLSISGNYTYYGVVYALNEQASTGYCVTTQGTSQIVGAVFVDGSCGVMAGSSKENIVYDQKAGGITKVAGDGAIIRNTWRELPSS